MNKIININVTFISNDAFKINSLEDNDIVIELDDSPIFYLNNQGVLPDNLFYFLSQKVNYNPRKIGININEG